MFRSDTESYDIIIIEPLIDSGIKKKQEDGGDDGKLIVTGVRGYNELTRHYFDGTNIIMEGYVSAYNGTDEECTGRVWFRHTEYDERGQPTEWQEEHPGPTVEFGPGETYGPHYTDPMILNFPVDGTIEEGVEYYLNAHIHLEVTGNGTTDVWHGTDRTTTFDEHDNP